MTASGFGAFGKIPSVGDFFRIDAPNGFVSVWDEWLQRCLVSGAHTYGDRWDELYMSAPIWRFTLSARLAGPDRVLGVLMASVDRVGRRFPLTLMTPRAGTGSAILDHFGNDALFETLEDTALAALEDDASKDSLSDALSALSPPETATDATMRRTSQGVFLTHAAGSDAAHLAAASLTQDMTQPSVWSAVTEADRRVMVCDGLPEGAAMQGLFDLQADVWKADHP